MHKTVSGIMLTMLLTGMLTLAFNIQTAKAEPEPQIIIGTTDSVEETLDPAQAYDYFGWCILQQISGTLVSVKPGTTTGTDYVPELAEDWNVSDDLKIWDFTLRQGISFPDGTEFNATHVKYSFDRAIALIPMIPEGAPAGLSYDLIINRIEVLATYKVRFYLNFPFSPFLAILACRASAIVDPKYAPMAKVNYTEGDARASTSVAFVGPYYLSTWTRVGSSDVEIKLDANPYYWNVASGYPKTKHIIFRFYTDSSTLRLAIEAGDVDMAFRHISPTDALDLNQNPNVKVWWGTGAFVQYLCFQEKRAPFNDTRVRVAVAAALNRSSVCETVFLGLSSPLYSIIPPGMLGHTEAFKKLGDANYTYTRSLLAELGYNESNKLTFDLWYESSGHYPSSADQALLYKEALEDSGVISVTLKSADWASYKLNRDNEIMDAYVYGWYPDYVDPDDYSFLYWASWIHTNYQNATQVALYDQARATTNLTRRSELYAQIDNMAVEQCSVVPLYVSSAWAVTKPTVYGIYLDITQDMRYWLVYIAKAEPRTWIVDDDGPADFHTIQEAINAANPGDTIFVKKGTYYENVVVNKNNLTVVGENSSMTIIDGSGIGTVVHVSARNVKIDGFTIQNSGYPLPATGIWITGKNVTIEGNILQYNSDGVYLSSYSTSNNIVNNTIADNKIMGIRVGWIFSDESSSENIIIGNVIARNKNVGLFIGGSSNNNTISNNTLISNRGFPGAICTGIYLFYGSANNTVINNTVMDSDQGIEIEASVGNVLIENVITNNLMRGILIYRSNGNTIIRNKITTNKIGIVVSRSSDNTIYHNNFIDNTQQVYSDDYANVWDNGYPSGGNYWSDYTGVDANGDGIGDTPYIIDADNQDRYPLMHPWSSLPVHNINTGLGYATIQEAINANETLNGHTIFVEAGTYHENIVINKTLWLIGENRETTIIDGSETGTVIIVSQDNINITGFTIQNSGFPYSGIQLNNVDNCNLYENSMKNNWFNVDLFSSSNNTIFGNSMKNGYYGIRLLDSSKHNSIYRNDVTKTGWGIYVANSSNNYLNVNNITACTWGINLEFSSNNNLSENILAANTAQGIWLGRSSNNSIIANGIANNDKGIGLYESANNILYHNNFINNTQQVYFLNSYSANLWDDGYPSGGNYWSDYVGVDVRSGPDQDLPGSDGIGDTPYIIDVNNTDRYPLMNPYGATPPPTYALTITTTTGGTTNPAPGTYSYTANSSVQVTAIPNANYLFGHWELDSVNVGVATPYTVLMDKDHTLKAVFALIPPPLSVSISPLSASIMVGQSVTFTSTVTGGYPLYTYQWYLNGNPVSGATSNTWSFTPTASGIYYVYLKVTDAKGNTAQSETARITVAAVPVGGYSIPIKVQTKAEPIIPYITLMTILTATFIKVKRKIKRER